MHARERMICGPSVIEYHVTITRDAYSAACYG